MTLEMNHGGEGEARQARAPAAGAKQRPEWADGLRKLYDSVVEEPLPDSFRDLLDQLDKND